MRSKTQRAFSLPELLCAIVIASILLGFAIPALSSFIEKNQQESLRDSLHAAVNFARMQAVLRKQAVDLCATSDGHHCNNRWQDGWMSKLSNAQNSLLNLTKKMDSSQVYWAGFEQRLRFYPNGTSPTSNGRFYQCSSNGVAWQLIINRQGRVRHATQAENLGMSSRCP